MPGGAAVWRPSSMTTVLLATFVHSSAGAPSHASASRKHVLNTGGAAGVAANSVSCTPQYPAGTNRIISIDVDGTSRDFLLKVPRNVNATELSEGLPAVVSLHGRGGNPWFFDYSLQQTESYNEDQIDETGAEPSRLGYKWLFALPFGTPSESERDGNLSCCGYGLNNLTGKMDAAGPAECNLYKEDENECTFNAGTCCGGDTVEGVIDDIGFIRELAAWLKSEMCASDDLFATGMSNGGMLSHRIGCELSGTFKAIAPIEATMLLGYAERPFGFAKCEPTEQVSVLNFCGTADPYCNGSSDTEHGHGNVTISMERWAIANGCDTTAPTVSTFQSATTHCQSYTGCPGKTFVEWCTIDDLGHSYSGKHKPATASAAQEPTNVDAFVFLMDKFSSLVTPRAKKYR